MRQLLVNIFFLSFFFSVSAQEKIYYDADWNETDVTNAAYYRTVNKKKELFVIKDFYISGKLQFKGFSKTSSDPLHYEGTCVWYHENGKLAQEVNYKNNKKHGDASYYFTNGNVKAKGVYTNDYADGLFSEYFPSGGLALQGSLDMNVIHGEMVKYDYKGRLEEKIHYKKGKQHGTYEEYQNGRILYKGSAFNGRQDGYCEQYYYNSGNLEKSYTLVDGKLDGTYKQYDENGKKAIEIVFINGVAQSYKLDDQRDFNYRLLITMELKDGVEHWVSTKNGKPIVKSFYKNGQRTGVWEMYDVRSNTLVLKVDYTHAEGCSELYKQGTEEEFSKNLLISTRFMSIYNFFSSQCTNVEFTVLKKTDMTQSIVSDYEYMEAEEPTENTGANEDVEETIIESVSGSDEPQCDNYKDYIYAYHCILVENTIEYNVFSGVDSKSLQIIKSQNTPTDRQLYFFYHDPYDVDENPVEFASFSIPKKLKKEIKKGAISKESIIETITEKINSYLPLKKEEIMKILVTALNE